jgi:hypothetical protein
LTRRKRSAEPPDTYGFRWDQLDVSRIADFDGQKCIEIATDYGSVHVYVSKGGRSIRVFKDNETEMTA